MAILSTFTVPVALVSVGTVLLILKIRHQRQSNLAIAQASSVVGAHTGSSDHVLSGSSDARNRDLRRAETMLLLDAIFLFTWCLGMTVVTAWIASRFRNLPGTNAHE